MMTRIQRFRYIPLVLSLGLTMPVCNAGPKRVLVLDSEMSPPVVWTISPKSNGGLLLSVDNHRSAAPVVYTIDKNGRRDDFLFLIPDAALINVYDQAIASDGEIALIGSASTNDGKPTTFVARVSADRARKIVTRTWPVVAAKSAGGKVEFLILDRPSGAWVPASMSGQDTPRWARVLGFDGNALVTSSDGKIRRFKPQ